MKAKKQLGKDKAGIQKVMYGSDYFGDCLGQFALNAISGLVGQLTYFYTDKVGLAAGGVATAFMLVRIIDAFTDLIMGYIIDHTKPGKERYRPWLLRMVVPTVILTIMLFTVPRGISSGLQIIYMFMTNFLLSAVVYTAICVPYSSLIVVRTSSQEERSRMGICRAATGYLCGMIITVGIIPITNMLGGDQRAWITFSTVIGVLSGIMLFITYKTSQETNSAGEENQTQQSEEEAIPMKEAVKNLFHNKYWVLALVIGVCSNVVNGLSQSSGTYYAKWIYGDDNLSAVIGAASILPSLLGFITVGMLVKHLGVTKTIRVTCVLGLLSQALRLLNPYHFIYNLILICVSVYANIPMMCELAVLTAMSIDFNEFKFGKRMIACSQGATSFGQKVGNGLGTAMIGWCLAIAAYDAAAEVLTEASKQAIFTFNIYAPVLMFVIMFICSLKYDLEKKLPGIQAEIAKRQPQEG